jgi:uncharacterized MAPEG superfamily protein
MMTPELTVLALAGLLQGVQLTLFATPANLEIGSEFTTGPRDAPPKRQLSVKTARLQRAMNNHFEGLILFTLAVVVVTLGQQSTAVTQYASYAYLVARILYVPAYALGLTPWRSVIWGVGFGATLIMITAALI